MLFLGLGTGLGSAMIVDGLLEPMEIAHPALQEGYTFEDYLGVRGLQRLARRNGGECCRRCGATQDRARSNYVVLGGGNAKLLKNSRPARGWATTRLPSSAGFALGGAWRAGEVKKRADGS